MDRTDSLDGLRIRLAAFVAERDWDQFHNPKNLAMALVAEARELVEHFQWLTAEQSSNLPAEALAEVELARQRLAVCEALVRTSSIDPLAAAAEKLELNASKYPIEKARGLATKYDKL